jgi:hypothetical protein
MKYLLLWSGNVRGMTKCKIDASENNIGICGHHHKGKRFIPNAEQLKAALPKRFHPAFDRQANWFGLPQIWFDARNNGAAAMIRLNYARDYKKPMVILYLQPLFDEVTS